MLGGGPKAPAQQHMNSRLLCKDQHLTAAAAWAMLEVKQLVTYQLA